MQFDVIVIGRGLAGLKAAELAAESGLHTASIEAQLFGGLVVGINELDGLPQALGIVSGVSLAGDLMARCTNLGVEQLSANVEAIRVVSGGFVVVTDDGDYRCSSVVVATGASRRKLGVPGEEEFRHFGVSDCADCDGPLYAGRDAVVVGGGDAAVQEATVLAAHVRTVHLVHRGKAFTAREDLQAAMRARSNVRLHLENTLEAISGGDSVTGVRLRGASSTAVLELPCEGVFIYVGLDPAATCVPQEVERDASGAIVTSANMESSIPGLYAVGAVRSGYGGRVVDAWDEAGLAVAVLKARR